jgi:protocatechuate 3,4-dioxygenase beta subunit
VLDRHAAVPDQRLGQIVTALIRHLHAFASEVRLTQDEWAAGIAFLTAAGHITDDQRQEFILLSDTLGLSMLVDLIDHRADAGETESTVLGPFWVADAPWRENGAVIARPQDGVPLHVSGRVLGAGGAPLAGAVVDTWQASGAGRYDVQDADQPPGNLRGRFRTDAAGHYDFWTVRPVAYPIPDDGPVGRMIAALGRHPWRAPHIHFRVSADGHRPVTTHVFDADGEYLDSDTVFGVKPSLVRSLERHDDGHYTLTYDIVLGSVRDTDA